MELFVVHVFQILRGSTYKAMLELSRAKYFTKYTFQSFDYL